MSGSHSPAGGRSPSCGSGAGPGAQVPITHLELSDLLAEYSRNGVPDLKGFCMFNIHDEAYEYLFWAESPNNLDNFLDWTKLDPCEESRQAVIQELICTEADYIRHLLSIVQVFIAAAHALQDAGKLLDINTEKLFLNIPDVLNANLRFWEQAIYPMIADAHEKHAPFNTEMMAPGFMHFREYFHVYEKYVVDQTKALDYLRSLTNNTDFMLYLTWCYRQKACNRLQLADIMVKPMQRLTKYSLLLRRLINHTNTEPERTSLQAMETCAKNHVQDLNRAIRYREELEKMDVLANSIESFEIDFKDEELDKHFHLYAQLNIKAPMTNCPPQHPRTLIYSGDLRFKDNIKEMEVRVFLLTDMIIVCKKLSKSGGFPFKLVRPKFFLERLICHVKTNPRNAKEVLCIYCVVIDELGSAHAAFSLSESSKDPPAQATLRTWELKIREAKVTYELIVWSMRNPSRDITEMDVDSSSDYGGVSIPSVSKPGVKQSSEEMNIDREARERVAAMLHRSQGASTECDNFSLSMNTDSFEGELSMSHGARVFPHGLRHPIKRNSSGGSSRNSRLSSFQQSTSAASHDEPLQGSSRNEYRAGSSVEHVIPPQNPEDAATSITVNVVSESESETVVNTQQATPPKLVLQQSSPHKTPPPLPSRSSSASRNTLRVSPENGMLSLVVSMPDLTLPPDNKTSPTRPQQSATPLSASEMLYQSHQELLQRNRLNAQQPHYLTPDQRGTSYPPPSPTRASLKRGLAFSHSFKNPPLSKMGHVQSQSQQTEPIPSTSQVTKANKAPSPTPSHFPEPDKDKKPQKPVNSRNKGSARSPAHKDAADKAE